MSLKTLEARASTVPPDLKAVEQLLQMATNVVKPQASGKTAASEEEDRFAAVHALRRSFVAMLSSGVIVAKDKKKKDGHTDAVSTGGKSKGVEKGQSDAAKALLDKFLDLLVDSGCVSAVASVKMCSVRTLFEFIKRWPAPPVSTADDKQAKKPRFVFAIDLFTRLLQKLLLTPSKDVDADVMRVIAEEYAEDYDDVRYYMLKSVKIIASGLGSGAITSTHDIKVCTARIVALLLEIAMPTRESDMSHKSLVELDATATLPSTSHASQPSKKRKSGGSNTGAGAGGKSGGEVTAIAESAKCLSMHWHKRVYSEAWLEVLKLPLTKVTYFKVLKNLSSDIMPYMVNPLMLCDFLTDSFSIGGVVSLLALEGIWMLMQQYQLDYPDFYTKLYSLLTLETLHAEYRAAFFKKLDMFLSSGQLASYIAAAFIKRMARLTMYSEVPVALFAIPFIANVLQVHVGLTKMIHRRDMSVARYQPRFRKRVQAEAESIPLYDAEGLDGEFKGDSGSGGKTEATDDDDVDDVDEKVDDESEGDDSDADSNSEGEDDDVDTPVTTVTKTKPVITTSSEGVDPFDAYTNDLTKCNAIDSSLWELTVLMQHHNPTIATLGKAFSSKPSGRKTVERCAQASYSSMLSNELNRTRSVKGGSEAVRSGGLLGDD